MLRRPRGSEWVVNNAQVGIKAVFDEAIRAVWNKPGEAPADGGGCCVVHKCVESGSELSALEAELAALKLGKLSKRAAATAGIDEDAVEAALDDDDDPKAALIALLLAHVEGSFH